MSLPRFANVQAAAERIAPYIHQTPVLTSQALNQLSGVQLYFKCENLQKTGAFKMRGASNAVLQLTNEQARNGVATHSSGNHAAALALAANKRGIPAYIVMPENASKVKRDAVNAYGGKIITCASTLDAREQGLVQVLEETGAYPVHPYNDSQVITGQGTAVLELIASQPELDYIVAPVGGGGLISGTAIAASNTKIAVIGAEPAQADDAYRSWQAGHIIPPVTSPALGTTIADGLRSGLGELGFAIMRERLADMITVSEAEIIQAMRLIWQRMKLVVEPSGAVPLAAILTKPQYFVRKQVGIILSGGNVDLDALPWMSQTSLL